MMAKRIALTAVLVVVGLALLLGAMWVAVYHDDVIWMALGVLMAVGALVGIVMAAWTVANDILDR